MQARGRTSDPRFVHLGSLGSPRATLANGRNRGCQEPAEISPSCLDPQQKDRLPHVGRRGNLRQVEEETGHEIALSESQLRQMSEFIESRDFEVVGVRLVGRTDGYCFLETRERGDDKHRGDEGRGRMLSPV